jgi:hypothetical protein
VKRLKDLLKMARYVTIMFSESLIYFTGSMPKLSTQVSNTKELSCEDNEAAKKEWDGKDEM